MKQDDMEKEKKKCSGTYLEDSHPDIYPESVKEESGYYVATKKKQGEYTIEDYRKLPEDERAELIDGTIYDMAAPLSVHQLLASKIYSSLAEYIEKNKALVFQCLRRWMYNWIRTIKRWYSRIL